MTSLTDRPASAPAGGETGRRRSTGVERATTTRTPKKKERASVLSTVILLIGAVYCLFPVFWVLMASTKDGSELFSTFTLAPSTHLWDNIVELTQYRDGLFWRWMLNTALYAGVGALISTYVSAMSGYVLAKFRFPGKSVVFKVLLMGVLVPGVILAIPQYFLMAQVGLTNTYWAVLLPQIISPYGIYLARIYAAASVPTEVIEAARTEGAREMGIFSRIALPMICPDS
jgi:multiple sugar transport system permease protein